MAPGRARMSDASQDTMIRIDGGEFAMGSDDFYPDEGPVRRVAVDGFWISPHPVTNDQFAAFVEETGYVTVAEQPPDPAMYPGAPEENLVPGASGVHNDARAGATSGLDQLVGVDAGR